MTFTSEQGYGNQKYSYSVVKQIQIEWSIYNIADLDCPVNQNTGMLLFCTLSCYLKEKQFLLS